MQSEESESLGLTEYLSCSIFGGQYIFWALNENLDKWAYYAAFWRTRDSVLVAAKRCAFSSR
jgi:hypothetical protein